MKGKQQPSIYGAKQDDIMELFEKQGLGNTGKFTLYDGRSGEP